MCKIPVKNSTQLSNSHSDLYGIHAYRQRRCYCINRAADTTVFVMLTPLTGLENNSAALPYCNLQAAARRIACVWTQAWLNQPISRKPLSFMLFETPKCVFVSARPADLFSSVLSIVYRAVQHFAEREEITMTGVSKLSAAVEKALSFFSPSSCSLTLFFFPLRIALSLSFPCNLPPQHTQTHTHTFFSFLILQMQVFWGNSILHDLQQVCVHRCVGTWTQKQWELYHLQIILGNYNRWINKNTNE